MKPFLINILKYTLLLLLIANGIALLSFYLLGRSNFYKPEFVKNGVAETKFDYVILGSSTGLTTLNTKLIDSLTGLSGLNISMDDSAMASHYLMLQHFYECGKSTNTLVLAVTPWDAAVASPPLNDNDYRFLPYVFEDYISDYYFEMERSPFKALAFSKYMPFIGMTYYNTEIFYPSLVSAVRPTMRNRFDEKGNYQYSVSGEFKSDEKFTETRLEIKNPFFRRIKNFCEKNEIKLIVYLSPMYATKVTTTQSLDIINHSDLLKDATFFSDEIHVNLKGRKAATLQFVTDLKTLNASLK